MSNFTDLLATIGKISPLIASVLPIPGAAIIGQAIAATFGGSWDNPKDLKEIIEKDPDAAVKILEIQSNMRVQLEQIAATNLANTLAADKVRIDAHTQAIENERLDRQNARELAKLSPMPARLSYAILIVFLVLIGGILLIPIDTDTNNLNLIYMLYGTISSGFTAVVTFWLGSSASSNKKDDLITSTNTQAATNAARTADEVRTALTATNAKTDRKLENLRRVGDQVHVLVNSSMTSQLKMNYILSDRIAQMTRHPDDIEAAKIAHKLYEEHEKAQEIVDKNHPKPS